MTLTLEQAADFLKLHPATLRERAKAGKIPGAAKPGKCWVFLQSGLEAYINNLSPCRSTASAASTTSTWTPRAGGLDDLLGLPTRRKRKPSTSASAASSGAKSS
jgi:GH24 family phage-related lysozyme (muramidase)